MNRPIVQSSEPILLVGGGTSNPDVLTALLTDCRRHVAADSGADTLLRHGITPEAVIGDLDSLPDDARAQIPPERIHHIPEQDSTDFDKCLRNISAPLIYGTGFLDPRIDHQLAGLTVLARRAEKRCILVGQTDVIALAPPRLGLALPPRTRVSLFPMGDVRGESTGLRWPLSGLDFAPGLRVGTSNETNAERLELGFDAPLMLIILPVEQLPALARGLLSAPEAWPARA